MVPELWPHLLWYGRPYLEYIESTSTAQLLRTNTSRDNRFDGNFLIIEPLVESAPSTILAITRKRSLHHLDSSRLIVDSIVSSVLSRSENFT